MKFFNIDLHIGVISDIKSHLHTLGHEVVDKTMSGHAWVLGRDQDHLDVISPKNWKDISPEMGDAFYERYKDELADFDAFIVTHTPVFAMLYERWGKPIITVASTRYEHPFTGAPDRWTAFNEFLNRMRSRGLLIPVANNKYDSAYAEYFTGFEWPVIPSFCKYTGIAYTGELSRHLFWCHGPHAQLPNWFTSRQTFRPSRVQRILNTLPWRTPVRGFDWSELGRYRSVYHLPYNASVMSIFEHYAGNIPLFFPDIGYLKVMYAGGDPNAFSQVSFNQVYGLPSGSSIGKSPRDPNDYLDVDNVMEWAKLSDFYDPSEFAGAAYFSSFEEMVDSPPPRERLAEMSRTMAENNVRRLADITESWRSLISRLPL